MQIQAMTMDKCMDIKLWPENQNGSPELCRKARNTHDSLDFLLSLTPQVIRYGFHIIKLAPPDKFSAAAATDTWTIAKQSLGNGGELVEFSSGA